MPVVQFCVLQRGRTHDQQSDEALGKVKGSMGSHERHALPGVIGDDLLRFGKLPLCLFICIILIGGDRGNHGAPYRLPTAQREQLVLERDALDIEWRNLILEENALGDHSRVERIIRKSCKCSMLIRHKKIS